MSSWFIISASYKTSAFWASKPIKIFSMPVKNKYAENPYLMTIIVNISELSSTMCKVNIDYNTNSYYCSKFAFENLQLHLHRYFV